MPVLISRVEYSITGTKSQVTSVVESVYTATVRAILMADVLSADVNYERQYLL